MLFKLLMLVKIEALNFLWSSKSHAHLSILLILVTVLILHLSDLCMLSSLHFSLSDGLVIIFLLLLILTSLFATLFVLIVVILLFSFLLILSSFSLIEVIALLFVVIAATFTDLYDRDIVVIEFASTREVWSLLLKDLFYHGVLASDSVILTFYLISSLSFSELILHTSSPLQIHFRF